ncbi:hypothetical protein B0H11DRAFT_1926029 [Mycena galericulata]|nr:hypothetical protein B0H11DRAFT_1926029 [Mycena galericulata]
MSTLLRRKIGNFLTGGKPWTFWQWTVDPGWTRGCPQSTLATDTCVDWVDTGGQLDLRGEQDAPTGQPRWTPVDRLVGMCNREDPSGHGWTKGVDIGGQRETTFHVMFQEKNDPVV